MAIAEVVRGLIQEQMDDIAEQIESDYKAIVSKDHGYQSWIRTGNAVNSIHIEQRGEFSYFIGAQINWGNRSDGGRHLYYLDEGNGGSKRKIYPKHGKALDFLDLSHPVAAVHGFDAQHLTQKIADKYNNG